MPGLAETVEDIAYVTSWFVALEPDPAFGTAIPSATYRTPDGRAWFARDVWRLADDAHGPANVRALFELRYLAACEALGYAGDLEEAWTGYLDGAYGACLRDVTPETIAAKERLVARLTAALATARPDDAAWCARLRADVEALDGLEKPFASCDRIRFGPTTRDRLITASRATYPHAFGATIERVIRTA